MLSVCCSAIKEAEAGIEAAVSEYIGQMPFLWMNVNDDPGRSSRREWMKRNAIALLSSYGRPAIDRPSRKWLGQYSDRERVRMSGLWNSDHVDETYDPSFLDLMEYWIDTTSP